MRLILLIAILSINTIQSQNKTNAQKAKQAIQTFFKGFHQGDTTLMRSVLANKVILQTTYINKKGETVLQDSNIDNFIKAIAKRPETQKWEERILSYDIKIDGTMANVWTPYEFWLNNQFSHCGVNSFQLYNDNGKWKIIYLIDTRRKKGCASYKK